MKVNAKFRCDQAVAQHDSQYVTFSPVYSSDPAHENYSWSQWTPSGNLSMNITNKNLIDHFVVGTEYMLTIEKA